MFRLLIVFLVFIIFQPTHEVTYSCNASAPCGCSTQPAVVTKIIGGENASQNTWGWAVSIRLEQTSLCGGTILSSIWIMTAAHCVYNLSPSQVIVSAASNELLAGTQVSVALSIIVHPDYNARYKLNDIALIGLLIPLNMSDPAIAKICLPIETNEDFPPVNSTLVAIGWGRLSENGSASSTLQQVTLQHIPYSSDTCYPSIVNSTMQFCAGTNNGGKDTCQGDSGGPLMMFTSSQQWVLVGITSYGRGCGQQQYSGVYTRVGYYLNWIRSSGVFDAVTVSETTTTTITVPTTTSTFTSTIVSTTTTVNTTNSTGAISSHYKPIFALPIFSISFIFFFLYI